jgi:putative transposase
VVLHLQQGKAPLGLTAGPVPPRVDAQVKAGLLALVAHTKAEAGWSLRKAAEVLGLDRVRVLRWQARAALDRLADAKPGPDVPVHALLDWEREAIVKLAEDWGETDLSHRKLAHRGTRLDLVHVSESTVLRVLTDAGLHLPGRPPRERRPFPEWAELVPGVIWIYDFTHFRAAKRCAVAMLDVVSRYWLATVVSAEESSTQIEVAFTKALGVNALTAAFARNSAIVDEKAARIAISETGAD